MRTGVVYLYNYTGDNNCVGLNCPLYEEVGQVYPDRDDTRFGSALASETAVAQDACTGLYRVCVNASEAMEKKPRYKKQAASVHAVSDAMLRRAIWSVAYWAQNEFVADPEWGFLPVWGA